MFEDDVDLYPLSDPSLSTVENLGLWQDRWMDSLHNRRVSEKSIRSYSETLSSLFDFIDEHPNVTLEEMGGRFFNRFLMWYQIKVAKKKKSRELKKLETEYAQSRVGKNDALFTLVPAFHNTLLHRSTVVRMFFRFISTNNAEGYSYERALSKMVVVKVSDRLTSYLKPKEMLEIIAYLQNWNTEYKRYYPRSNERYAVRNALMLLLYALTGARGDEVVKVRLKDIDEDTIEGAPHYIISIHHGKGGKVRRVGVKKEFIEKFVHFLRRELPSKDYYVSSTYRSGKYLNKPFHVNNIRKFANVIFRILGFDNVTGLHAFRRGYVTKRVREGVSVGIVAKEVGNTTQVLEKHYLKDTI